MAATVGVVRDARIAGIRKAATLQAVQRRRSQLGFVLLVVLLGLCVGTALMPLGNDRTPVDAGVLRLGLIGLSVTFVAYAVEKERALRRLERALAEEKTQAEALAVEAERLHRLVNAGHAVTATLELDRVADLSLAAAMRIFDAPGGVVFLNRGDLVVHAVQGDERRVDLADQHARAVAASREPALVAGPNPEAPVGMAAPIVRDGEVLGVIVLSGGEETRYGEQELATLDAFSRHTAAALTNARLYRAEKVTNQQFAGLHDAEAEFRWLAPSA